MHIRHLLVALFAAFIIPSMAASAQEVAPKLNPLAFAMVLLEHGQADEACALLNVVFGPSTTNSRALYLYGECHLAQGQDRIAATYYERALRQEPQAVAVRAKLAGVYLRLGRSEEAGATLLVAEQVNPGSEAARNLADLAEIPIDARVPEVAVSKNWNGSVQLARIYDSNANGGSIASTVDAIIGGVPLTLDIAPSSQATPDWGTSVSAAGSYLHPMDAHYALVLRGHAFATLYDNEGEYDRQNIGVGAGVVYRDPQVTWSVVPNLVYSWQDGNPDELLAAVDGRINYKLSPQMSIIGAGQVGYASVPFDHSRDSWIGLSAIGIDYAFNPHVNGGFQLVARRSVGDISTEAYAGIGPEIYLSADLTDALTIDASYSFTNVEYDESLSVFPQGRRDNRQSLGAALNLDLSDWQEGLSVFARYNYLHTDSSVSLYTSDRHLVAAGIRFEF